MLTREKTEAIVEAGNWLGLVGEIESDFLECKGTPYDLANESHRLELAKDVSALANAEGGLLLLGISTKKSATLAFDEIAELKAFPSSIFSRQQYLDVIAEWVYPTIDGLRAEWRQNASDATRGFGVVWVPAQQPGRGPFIISKTVLTSGRRTEILFGYAERKLDVNDPATAGDLQRWLRDGMGFQRTIEQRLEELRQLLLVPGSAPPPAVPDMTARIENTLEATGLREKPHYVLAAYPLQTSLLPTVFAHEPGSPARLLEGPPVLRRGGWSLETLNPAAIMEGKYLRVVSGRRKVIDLYRDGAFIFAGLADPSFLGAVSANERLKHLPKLNTLALVEVTYLFCLFYAAIIELLEPAPTRIAIRRVLGHMHNDEGKLRTYVNPTPNDSIQQLTEDNWDITFVAPKDAADDVLEFEAALYDPGQAAYQLIENLFLWFGVPPGRVPYSTEALGKGVINTTAIGRRGP